MIDRENEYQGMLMNCTKAQLRRAYELLGEHFKSTLRKAEMVEMLADYVLLDPKSILRSLDVTSLSMIKYLLDAPPGMILKSPFHLEELSLAEELLLVHCYDDSFTRSYCLPVELYDAFKPHIEEVFKQPAEHQKEELVENLSSFAEVLRETVKTEEGKASLMFELSMMQLLEHLDHIAMMLDSDDYSANEYQLESDSLQQETEEIKALYETGGRHLQIPEEDFQLVLQDLVEIQAELHERIREKSGFA